MSRIRVVLEVASHEQLGAFLDDQGLAKPRFKVDRADLIARTYVDNPAKPINYLFGVVELRAICGNLGLKVSGLKAGLTASLIAWASNT